MQNNTPYSLKGDSLNYGSFIALGTEDVTPTANIYMNPVENISPLSGFTKRVPLMDISKWKRVVGEIRTKPFSWSTVYYGCKEGQQHPEEYQEGHKFRLWEVIISSILS